MSSKKELPQGVDPERIILVGDCNKKFRGKGIFAGDCPPAEPYITFAIQDKRDYIEDGPTTREDFEATCKIFQEYIKKKGKNTT